MRADEVEIGMIWSPGWNPATESGVIVEIKTNIGPPPWLVFTVDFRDGTMQDFGFYPEKDLTSYVIPDNIEMELDIGMDFVEPQTLAVLA